MSTFEKFITTKLLEVKINRNENFQAERNIMAKDIEISPGKNLIRVKHLKKINKKLKRTNVSVNCFPGVYTNNMKHYMKPPTNRNLNTEVVEIHTGKNDLSSSLKPAALLTNITSLAADIKTNFDLSCNVIVLPIVARGDQLNHKATNANEELNELRLSKYQIY